jgi:hypothetical protein
MSHEMSLFSRISSAFTAFANPSPEAREASAVETREDGGAEIRTPGQLAAWLSNWGGDADGSLKDPYRLSPWVGRAIKHIAGPIAQVRLEFYQESNGSKSEVRDPELSAFWDRPAKGLSMTTTKQARLSRFDVIEATVGWLTLAGEFFWIVEDSGRHQESVHRGAAGSAAAGGGRWRVDRLAVPRWSEPHPHAGAVERDRLALLESL